MAILSVGLYLVADPADPPGYSVLGTGAVIFVLALGTFVASGALPELSRRVSQRHIVQTVLLFEAIAVGGLAFSPSVTVVTSAIRRTTGLAALALVVDRVATIALPRNAGSRRGEPSARGAPTYRGDRHAPPLTPPVQLLGPGVRARGVFAASRTSIVAICSGE